MRDSHIDHFAVPPTSKITDYRNTRLKQSESLNNKHKQWYDEYIKARRRYGLDDDEE